MGPRGDPRSARPRGVTRSDPAEARVVPAQDRPVEPPIQPIDARFVALEDARTQQVAVGLEIGVHAQIIIRADREQLAVERRVMQRAQRQHVPQISPVVGVIGP